MIIRNGISRTVTHIKIQNPIKILLSKVEKSQAYLRGEKGVVKDNIRLKWEKSKMKLGIKKTYM